MRGYSFETIFSILISSGFVGANTVNSMLNSYIGYDQAEPGGKFLKIGVGVLQRSDDNPYNSFRLYDINNPGEWKIKKKTREVQFIHILKDTDYSYKYIKTVKLIKGSPEMHLEHTLSNTGNKTIETTVYNHNFLIIDQELTGPNYKITFPFEMSGKGQGIGEIAIFMGNQIQFLREMSKSERIYCGSITGLRGTLNDYNFTVENLRTGTGVRISCDRPLIRLVFWCSPVTLYPEPYINIKIEPGESFRWIVFYQFYMSEVQGME